jgi:predicted transcriptional regulator
MPMKIRKEELRDLEIKILKYHKIAGADYSKLISHRFGLSLSDAMKIHKKLLELGFLEKVSGSIINYHTKLKNGKYKYVKHRNHTYYTLSRKGKHFIREYEKKFGEIHLDLKYPYKS